MTITQKGIKNRSYAYTTYSLNAHYLCVKEEKKKKKNIQTIQPFTMAVCASETKISTEEEMKNGRREE